MKNGKIAFVFPGQGAQYVGMAKDFLSQDQDYLDIIMSLEKKISKNIYEIMQNGPEEVLKETSITQPAILLHSISALRTFLNRVEVQPDYVAGHSLGEYSALVANGCLSLEDALYLVHKRGKFMIEANAGEPFGMAAIMGLDSGIIQQICVEVSEENLVVAANFNTPEQTVISGSEAGVLKAMEKAKEMKAKRAIPLQVGGPFHSPLIKKAEEWLRNEIYKINFNKVKVPVVANVDAKEYADPEEIRMNLVSQVTSSVRWVDTIKYFSESGVDTIFEFGPKKVLSGMIKKIDRNIRVFSVDDNNDIDLVLKELKDE